MQDVIHNANLTDRGRRDLYREALLEQAVTGQQRSVSVIDLVRLGVEEIEKVELDTPDIVEPVAQPTIEDTGRRRAECTTLGERARATANATYQTSQLARRD